MAMPIYRQFIATWKLYFITSYASIEKSINVQYMYCSYTVIICYSRDTRNVLANIDKTTCARIFFVHELRASLVNATVNLWVSGTVYR